MRPPADRPTGFERACTLAAWLFAITLLATVVLAVHAFTTQGIDEAPGIFLLRIVGDYLNAVTYLLLGCLAAIYLGRRARDDARQHNRAKGNR